MNRRLNLQLQPRNRPWVPIAEIFPAAIRGQGVAIFVSALWIASFLLTFTFPLLNVALGPTGSLLLYSAICAAGFVFVYLIVPEIKGTTLEQIEQRFAHALTEENL